MKDSRRNFFKTVSFFGLGLSTLPLFSSNHNSKKIPILIGIGKSGFDVMKLCNNNRIDVKNYLIEQRHERFSLPFHALRGYVNPDIKGKPMISEFKDLILNFLKVTNVDYKNCLNPIIITNVIGDPYGTIAGRAMFDDLQKNNANVYWVLGFPHRGAGKKAFQTASKYTHDISHLPNVIINNIELDQNEDSRDNIHLKANKESGEILFSSITNIIDNYHRWQGLL